jgi:O-antigen/teichoic acid export membrane protein
MKSPSAGSLAASIFGQATLLVSGPVTARLLGVTGRGELAMLMIIATLGSVLGASGIPTAVAYAVASQRVPAVCILRVVASTWLQLCFVAGAISAAAVLLIVRGTTSSPLWLEAPLVAVAVVAVMTSQLILACVQGERRFRLLNWLRPFSTTLAAVGLLSLFLVSRHSGVAPVLGISAAAYVTTCLVGGTLLAVGSDASGVVAPFTKRSLLRYGLSSLAGANAPLETLSIDQAVVGLLLSRHGLGLYAVGGAFDNLSSTLVSGIGTIALPRIAGAPDRESRDALMKRTFLIAVALAAAAAFFAEAIVGWLLPIAFGQAFAGAVAPARVLIVAGFFMGVRRILVVFLQAIGRPGRTGVGELVALVTLLVFAAVLIPLLGLVGAALALLVAAVAANCYLLLVLRAQTGGPTSSAPSRLPSHP